MPQKVVGRDSWIQSQGRRWSPESCHRGAFCYFLHSIWPWLCPECWAGSQTLSDHLITRKLRLRRVSRGGSEGSPWLWSGDGCWEQRRGTSQRRGEWAQNEARLNACPKPRRRWASGRTLLPSSENHGSKTECLLLWVVLKAAPFRRCFFRNLGLPSFRFWESWWFNVPPLRQLIEDFLCFLVCWCTKKRIDRSQELSCPSQVLLYKRLSQRVQEDLNSATVDGLVQQPLS